MATIDYKEKYEQALEVAQRFYNNSVAVTKKGLEDIFPELKESEDERTRKEIVNFINHKKAMGSVTPEESKRAGSWIAWLEMRGEQKPADKVEPKFKVGDYVVGKYISGYISEVRDDCYLLDYQGFSIDKQDNYHLWTIQDAKDGDVLDSTRVQATIIFKGFAEDGKHINAYCALQSGMFIHQETLWDRDFEPASENWKNALFDAMKEAGYEWDAEKKELKMIEQKSAWSEDDEKMTRGLLSMCDVYSTNFSFYPKENKDIESLKNWLKHLKERYTWKPSDEQIKALEFVIKSIDNMLRSIGHIDNVTKPRLEEVLAALKKLRQE